MRSAGHATISSMEQSLGTSVETWLFTILRVSGLALVTLLVVGMLMCLTIFTGGVVVGAIQEIKDRFWRS